MLQKLKNPNSLFGSDICICVAQSQRMFENHQGIITKLKKKIFALINDQENNISYSLGRIKLK